MDGCSIAPLMSALVLPFTLEHSLYMPAFRNALAQARAAQMGGCFLERVPRNTAGRARCKKELPLQSAEKLHAGRRAEDQDRADNRDDGECEENLP
jgi:hypothetical protein